MTAPRQRFLIFYRRKNSILCCALHATTCEADIGPFQFLSTPGFQLRAEGFTKTLKCILVKDLFRIKHWSIKLSWESISPKYSRPWLNSTLWLPGTRSSVSFAVTEIIGHESYKMSTRLGTVAWEFSHTLSNETETTVNSLTNTCQRESKCTLFDIFEKVESKTDRAN